jgi:hypothetical protein
MYKLIKNLRGDLDSVLLNNEDGSVTSIPMVADNTDYQEYLKWVAAGNTPLPADGE